jgi:hypothetical protein
MRIEWAGGTKNVYKKLRNYQSVYYTHREWSMSKPIFSRRGRKVMFQQRSAVCLSRRLDDDRRFCALGARLKI